MTLNAISKEVEQEAADLVGSFVTDEQIHNALANTTLHEVYDFNGEETEDGYTGGVSVNKDEVLGTAEYLLEIHAPEGMAITTYDIANLAVRVEKLAEEQKPTIADYFATNE